MRILPPTVDDAEVLTDLHLDVWDEAYTGLVSSEILAARRQERPERIERWRTILAETSSTTLAWDDAGQLLGFASTGTGRDEDQEYLPGLEVMALYVRARAYGRGVGWALLDAVVGSAAAYLWVLDGNQRAISFYERQGFRFDGATKPEGPPLDPGGVSEWMAGEIKLGWPLPRRWRGAVRRS